MNIYNFNKETKEFISKTVATESPLEKGKYLIPANATIKEPLATKENFAVCFNEDKQEWEYIEDNRNKTVYSTITKEASIVDYLGAIKDGFTLLAPTEFDKWENNSWVADETLIQNKFRAQRDSLLLTVVDHYQKPLVWESLTTEQQDKVRVYRQALLDSTVNWVLPEELVL